MTNSIKTILATSAIIAVSVSTTQASDITVEMYKNTYNQSYHACMNEKKKKPGSVGRFFVRLAASAIDETTHGYDRDHAACKFKAKNQATLEVNNFVKGGMPATYYVTAR